MENRVKNYNLNAKKAYEFAAGLRIVLASKNRTKRIYGKTPGRPTTYDSSKFNILNAEEQEVFLQGIEFGFRYSKLMNSRLDSSVEEKFLLSAKSQEDIKYLIDYCTFWQILIPVDLRNRIIMQTAIPADKSGLNFTERYKIGVSERKQKRFLKKFQEQKNSFKIILEGLIKENNLCENSTIKDLFEAMN